MELKLIYPDLPFWRAEASRIALFMGGIEFEDCRPSREEIKRMKTDGTFPFGQFPILLVDGEKLAQTAGIARFCGKLAGLYPRNDDFAAAKVDEVIDLATDITLKMQPALREQNPEIRNIKRTELSREILPRWLGFMDQVLIDNGNTGFFVGPSLTVGDLAAWRLCGWIQGGIIDRIPQTQLDAHPALLQHYLKIGKMPKIIEWMKRHYNS